MSFWQGRLVKDIRLERAKEFLTKNFHTLLDSMKHVGLPAADGQSKQSLKESTLVFPIAIDGAIEFKVGLRTAS